MLLEGVGLLLGFEIPFCLEQYRTFLCVFFELRKVPPTPEISVYSFFSVLAFVLVSSSGIPSTLAYSSVDSVFMFSHFLFLSQSCIIQAKTVPHGERLVDTKNRTSSAGPSLQPASTGQKIKIMNLNNCSPPIKFSLVDVLVYIYII